MAEPGNDDDDVADIDAMMDVEGPPADTTRGIASLHGVPGVSVFICGRRRVAPCMTEGCGKPHTSLCDYPLTGSLKGKTCDRKMCEGCRVKQPGKDRDFCRAHDEIAKRANGG